jgi:hypothetical protein
MTATGMTDASLFLAPTREVQPSDKGIRSRTLENDDPVEAAVFEIGRGIGWESLPDIGASPGVARVAEAES